MQGELGGKGIMCSRALFTASLSTPANTVTLCVGRLSFFKLSITPGRALAAAHPHTEFTTISVVPGLDNAESTASALNN